MIHWVGTPDGVCARKDSQEDRSSVTQANGVTITSMAEAIHPGNVTCPICKKEARKS